MNPDSELERRVALLERDLEKVLERNRRVELDKAWEMSVARKVLIGSCTYGVTALVFYLVGIAVPLRNALIPTLAYFLSTLTLGKVKAYWIAKSETSKR